MDNSVNVSMKKFNDNLDLSLKIEKDDESIVNT